MTDSPAPRRILLLGDAAVRRLQQDKGIAAGLITTKVLGDREQVSACAGKFPSRAQELECLLPNRRVEVNFITTRAR